MWDNHLFVFECKSHSLPLLNPQQRYWFTTKMASALEQVDRLATAAETYRDEMSQRLRTDEWQTIVPFVVNAFPWSYGKVGDAWVLDLSAGFEYSDGIYDVSREFAFHTAFLRRRRRALQDRDNARRAGPHRRAG